MPMDHEGMDWEGFVSLTPRRAIRMALLEIQWNPSPRELRVFAALQAVFFLIVATALHRRNVAWPVAAGTVGVSAVVAAVGLAAPKAVRPIYIAWMAAVTPIGWIVSHALMAAVYFGVVTPIGLLMRLTGRDPMCRRLDRSAATYWTPRPLQAPASRYFRQS